jgi:hypothetical protein
MAIAYPPIIITLPNEFTTEEVAQIEQEWKDAVGNNNRRVVIVPHGMIITQLQSLRCSYCGDQWKPDERGGCSACGAPPNEV